MFRPTPILACALYSTLVVFSTPPVTAQLETAPAAESQASGLDTERVDHVLRQLEIKEYFRSLGSAFQPILDTSAFATCP